MTIIDNFDARRAAELCGFRSTAMLDYLQRSGVFVASRKDGRRRGKGRRYSFRDLMVLKTIKQLLDSGASVAALRKSLTEFQSKKWYADPVTLEDRDGVIKYLIVSGSSVYLKSNPETLVDLSRNGQLSFSFIIDLEILQTQLRKSMNLPVIEQIEMSLDATAQPA